jgi:4-hydroxybenzoate polyprenyltransferase
MESVASQLVFLIQVSRPIVWPVLPLVYVLGLRASGAGWNAIVVAQIVLLTFPMNLIGCGLNDIYDYESDRRSTRRRAIWGALVTPENQKFVFHACAAMMPLMVLSSLLTRNKDNFVATVGLVVVAWAYSVPPFRLKERPPLDSLANGLGYFLFPLMMGYSIGGDPRYMPIRYYWLALCVAGVSGGVCRRDAHVRVFATKLCHRFGMRDDLRRFSDRRCLPYFWNVSLHDSTGRRRAFDAARFQSIIQARIASTILC